MLMNTKEHLWCAIFQPLSCHHVNLQQHLQQLCLCRAVWMLQESAGAGTRRSSCAHPKNWAFCTLMEPRAKIWEILEQQRCSEDISEAKRWLSNARWNANILNLFPKIKKKKPHQNRTVTWQYSCHPSLRGTEWDLVKGPRHRITIFEGCRCPHSGLIIHGYKDSGVGKWLNIWPSDVNNQLVSTEQALLISSYCNCNLL